MARLTVPGTDPAVPVQIGIVAQTGPDAGIIAVDLDGVAAIGAWDATHQDRLNVPEPQYSGVVLWPGFVLNRQLPANGSPATLSLDAWIDRCATCAVVEAGPAQTTLLSWTTSSAAGQPTRPFRAIDTIGSRQTKTWRFEHDGSVERLSPVSPRLTPQSRFATSDGWAREVDAAAVGGSVLATSAVGASSRVVFDDLLVLADAAYR